MKDSHKIRFENLPASLKNATGNPAGPGDLSPLKFWMTSKTSASSKGLSNQTALSPDIIWNSSTSTSEKGRITCCSEYKFMKNWVIQFSIIPWLEDKLPLTNRLSIPLFLLLEFVILWKNLVLESPSLKWRTLDFYLQLISSNKVNFSIYAQRLICSSFSLAIKVCISPLASNAFSLLQSCWELRLQWIK